MIYDKFSIDSILQVLTSSKAFNAHQVIKILYFRIHVWLAYYSAVGIIAFVKLLLKMRFEN